MVYVWQTIMFIIVLSPFGRGDQGLKRSDYWRAIEDLAEEYPYIVALLDQAKRYSCTGMGIQSRTVLTTGNCVKNSPSFIAHGTAVIDRHVNNNTLLKVVATTIHPEYMFEMKTGDLYNVTKLHSNIGLVYADRNFLDLFVGKTYLGNYYASELKDKALTVIGYERQGEEKVAMLQKISYRQAPCANPKWYYCICGFELYMRSIDDAYKEPFGEGAPVFYGREIVAITATKCGVLELPVSNIKYNIFTVIGPYTAWIDKDSTERMTVLRSGDEKLHQNSSSNQYKIMSEFLKYIWIFIVISKFFI